MSERETVSQQKNATDGAIDIGGTGTKQVDVPDGPSAGTEEIESNKIEQGR